MCVRLPFNRPMDIYEVRRSRLLALIDQACDGKQATLSARTGIKASQINRWISVENKSPRRITEESARSIESSMRLPKGWLDHLDAGPLELRPMPVALAACEPVPSYETVAIAEVVAIMRRFSETEQQEALRAVRFIEVECRERRQNSTKRTG